MIRDQNTSRCWYLLNGVGHRRISAIHRSAISIYREAYGLQVLYCPWEVGYRSLISPAWSNPWFHPLLPEGIEWKKVILLALHIHRTTESLRDGRASFKVI